MWLAGHMRNRSRSFMKVATVCLCLALPVQPDVFARTPIRWDGFSQIHRAEEVARLDNYARELRKLPDSLAVVVIYGGRRGTSQGEVVARLFGIRNHLMNRNAIQQDRIVILDGGFRDRLEIQLWILSSVSRGDATLLIDSEIDTKNVRLKRPAIRNWVYRCAG